MSTAVANEGATLSIIDRKFHVPVVTLSTQDSLKLLKQLKSSFKRTINWNKYPSKASIQTQNQYLDYQTDPNFQGVSRCSVLSFKNNTHQRSSKRFFVPNVEIKNYNVMISGKNIFHQSVKNEKSTNDNIQKIKTDQRDDYKAGCLLDYVYFKNYCKIIAKNLSKRQEIESDPKATKQIRFAGNLEQDRNGGFFFIIEKAKETIFCIFYKEP